MMTASSSESAVLLPRLYCTMAVAVPTLGSDESASPTGWLEAPVIAVYVVPLRIANVAFAVVIFPNPQRLMEAVRFSVAVLLFGPVVQNTDAPVYSTLATGPTQFGVMVNAC